MDWKNLKWGDCEEPRKIGRDGGVHEIVKKTQTNKNKNKWGDKERPGHGSRNSLDLYREKSLKISGWFPPIQMEVPWLS
jgi:hypothetical protein